MRSYLPPDAWPCSRRDWLKAAGAAMALLGVARSGAATEPGRRLRAAVVGHTGRGDYGHGLESIFSGRAGIEVVALADPDAAGRERVAAKIGAAKSYSDYREMLAREKPALVSLAMRHADQHFAIAKACLEAGAHLYCEKPFVTFPAEADELLALSERRGLRIAVAHTMRMMPVIVQLKRGLAAGQFGRLVEMRAYGKQDARAGGEDMMVLGTHLFDLMRLLAGDPTWCSARVEAEGRAITRQDARLVKDNVSWVAGNRVFAQFAFAEGVSATFSSAAELRETVGHWGIELHCEKGIVRINCDISPNVFVRGHGIWKSDGRTDLWRPLDSAFTARPLEHNLGPVEDWLEAIQQGREPECSGRNGAWAVEMAMGVYCSALNEARVNFPLRERNHPLAR